MDEGDGQLLGVGVLVEGVMIGEGVLLLSKPLCAVGGGEGVGRTFSRETALQGGSVRPVLVAGVGLGKRQWLDEELRVAATAHSIML